MKTILTIISAILLVNTSIAQTEKGKKFIGGYISVTGYKNTKDDLYSTSSNKNHSFQLSPRFGAFINDKLALGGYVTFISQKEMQTGKNNWSQNGIPNLEYSTTYHTIGYGAGAFIRKYKMLTEKLFFTGTCEIGYMHQDQKKKFETNDPNHLNSINNPDEQLMKFNLVGSSIAPGFTYFVTPKLGVDASFGRLIYSFSTSKNVSLPSEINTKANNFNIDLNINSFSLGLNYYF